MGEPPGDLQQELSGTWFRSFEEETGDELVFRAPGYDFPRSRAPRSALKLAEDGTAITLAGGPADRPEPVRATAGDAASGTEASATGQWSVSDGTLSVSTPGLSGSFTVAQVGPGRLVVRPVGNR